MSNVLNQVHVQVCFSRMINNIIQVPVANYFEDMIESLFIFDVVGHKTVEKYYFGS